MNDAAGRIVRVACPALQDRARATASRRIGCSTEALTHSSFQGEGRGAALRNERLEFLGDRVLGLRHRQPAVPPLSRRGGRRARPPARRPGPPRSAGGDRRAARTWPTCLRLSRGEEEAGGRRNPGLLADACEALIAAVYLDGGFDGGDGGRRAPVARADRARRLAAEGRQDDAAGMGAGPAACRCRSTARPSGAARRTRRCFVSRSSVEGLDPVDGDGPVEARRRARRRRLAADQGALPASRRCARHGRQPRRGAGRRRTVAITRPAVAALRLRRCHRGAQRRQIHPGQPAGRQQGQHRLAEGADHPRPRSRHRHDRGMRRSCWSTRRACSRRAAASIRRWLTPPGKGRPVPTS